MESLITFIIIIAINIISKSIKEKKKIEKARMKRIEELKRNPQPRMSQRIDKVDRTGREVKEIFVKRENKVDKKTQYNFTVEEKPIKSYQHNVSTKTDNYIQFVEEENKALRELKEETHKELKSGFERKKLVNAIIWSEIIGEPKSIQNLKKGFK